jgi:hypothetical protein
VSALDAAVAVAREHGLRVDEPRVLKDAHNLLVHLAPSPVVARVGQTMADLRPNAQRHELQVTTWLVERGLPVLPPSPELPARVHERDGSNITFWPYVERQEARDGAAAGRALREINDALRGYDGELDGFWPIYETRELLVRTEAPMFLTQILERLAKDLWYDPVALHGDAHFRNCYFTADGPLWADLEDACLAPPEWDAACLAAVLRMLADKEGYAEALAELEIEDEQRFEQLVILRTIVMVAWPLYSYGPSPDVEERIEWLRRNVL